MAAHRSQIIPGPCVLERGNDPLTPEPRLKRRFEAKLKKIAKDIVLRGCRHALAAAIFDLDQCGCRGRARRLNETAARKKSKRSWIPAELDCLGVAAAAGYAKPWIAFARQKFTGSGFDERSNHLQ